MHLIQINVKEMVEQLKQDLKQKLEKIPRAPTLAILQVGDNLASNAYIRGKKKDCDEVGIVCIHHKLDSTSCSENDLIKKIEELNNDSLIDGIIVQLPLPLSMNAERITSFIAPEKDVDGFVKDSLFYPCTPLGILLLLDKMGITVEGKNVVIIGRSKIVGEPLAKLMLKKNATVTICHSKTPKAKLKDYCLNADIVVSAVGQKDFYSPDFLNNNQIIIDVGINKDSKGKLCGDLSKNCYSSSEQSRYTPVPGGVGLLTRYALIKNVYQSALNKIKKEGEKTSEIT